MNKAEKQVVFSPPEEKREDNRFRDNIPLLRLAKAGDRQATEQLFLLNGGLVKSIAHRFLGRGTDFEDLTQIGFIGLLKAIRTFDESRGNAFSTYAVPLIFGEIRRFLRDDGPIKISRLQKKLGAKLNAMREECLAAGMENVRIEDLAARCGVSAAEAAEALDATTPVSSLSDLLYADEEGPTLEMRLSDEQENEKAFDKITVAAAIQKLPKQQKQIILLRYFRDCSQEETAVALGLSQVKISREEKKILAFLRQELS